MVSIYQTTKSWKKAWVNEDYTSYVELSTFLSMKPQTWIILAPNQLGLRSIVESINNS